MEVFGPHDADGFEGLGLTKALADHLEGVLGSVAAQYLGSWPTSAHVVQGHAGACSCAAVSTYGEARHCKFLCHPLEGHV
jgi:hypothetical protein